MLSDYRQVERTKLEERRTIAEAQVASAMRHLARQYEIIKYLESNGLSQSAATARELLCLFVEVTALHTAGCDKLVKSLAELR